MKVKLLEQRADGFMRGPGTQGLVRAIFFFGVHTRVCFFFPSMTL
jgi:hypothetical protein